MLSSTKSERVHVQRICNELLADLPDALIAEVRARSRRVSLPQGTIIDEPGELIEHFYFIESGVVSSLIDVPSAMPHQVATVGREGVVGLPLFFGARRAPATTRVDVDMVALRLSAADFSEVARSEWLSRRLHRYALALFVRMAHESACSRVHSTLERCARLLLVAHDRADGARLHLTQELAAHMLGVRRVSVGIAAQKLRDMGCIEYVRGRIEVRDRARLQACSCECYEIVRGAVDQLFGPGMDDDLAGDASARDSVVLGQFERTH